MVTSNRIKADAAKRIRASSEHIEDTIDPFLNSRTAEYTPLVELKPLPGISPLRNLVVPEGGAITLVNGEIEIDGSLEKTALYSRKRGRYLPGVIGLAGIGVRIPDPSTGHYEFGYGDGEGNRFGIEVDNGTWYTFIESDGNRYYRNPQSSWLDSVSDFDSTKGIILRLPFGWYGYLSVEFNIAYADRKEGDKIVTVDRSGHDNTGVSIVQPDLPVFAEADGGVMYVGGRQYGVYGRYNPQFRITSSPSVSKSVTTEEPIISFRVKNGVETKWRGVQALLEGVSIFADNATEWSIYIDGDLTGASFGALPSVPVTETALEIDTSATAVANGYRSFTDIVAGGSTGNSVGSASQELGEINLPSGSIITLAAKSLNTTSVVTAVLRLKEEF